MVSTSLIRKVFNCVLMCCIHKKMGHPNDVSFGKLKVNRESGVHDHGTVENCHQKILYLSSSSSRHLTFYAVSGLILLIFRKEILFRK